MTRDEIKNIFTYHAPTNAQRDRYERLREEAKAFAFCIIECTPASADQSAAIRKLRECVMTANAAIALEDS